MNKPLWFILTLQLVLLPASSWANQDLQLSIASWQLDDIQAQNLNIDIQLSAHGLELSASADSIKLAEPIGVLKLVKLHCEDLLIVSKQTSCAKGTLAFIQKQLGPQSIRFEVTAQPESNTYKAEVSGIKLASAIFSLTAKTNPQGWKVFADSRRIELKALGNVIAPYLSSEQNSQLADWDYDGKVKLDLDVAGKDSEIGSINADLKIEQLGLSDSQGKYVTEQLMSTIHLSLENKQQDWHWLSTVKIEQGEAYAEPIFIDFSETPIELNSEGIWLPKSKQFELIKTSLEQKQVMQLTMKGRGSASKLESLNVEAKSSHLKTFYSLWMQPFLLGSALDSLELTGNLGLVYKQHGDNYHVSVDMGDVFIADTAERFNFDKLSGRVGWSNYQYSELIDLNWSTGKVYAIALGASHLQASVSNELVMLQQPWSLPILDGELHINEFTLQKLQDDLPQWAFTGELTPISMSSLSSALDWPLMYGKLSGSIPKVSYANHQVKVDGALKVNLFEGETVIDELQLNNPFGVLPQLHADVMMANINLETLTQTFDFGKITGKLSGQIDGLRLSNWKPVAFDAQFMTPVDDKSRHKISQQAVDNLSQVGGGATGVLQRSALGFFKNFSYKRLGLSCKLRNTVCEMSGVGKAEQGYYIVKGGGLPPRINVIGYTRRVNWPDLIERLEMVSHSDGPVIELN